MEDKKLFILKNTGVLYLRYGIKNLTMDNVAQELGISKKTLYQYFKSKADLIARVIDYYLENPVFDLNDNQHGNAIDRYFILREHIIGILKYYNNNHETELKKLYPKIYRKVQKHKRERIYLNTFENLKDGMESGLYRSELDIEVIAKLQVGRMLLTLNPDYGIFTMSELSNIDLYDKVMEYHMYSICTEEGIKYFKKQLNNRKNEIKN